MDREGEKKLYYVKLLVEENEDGEEEKSGGVKEDENEKKKIAEGIKMLNLKRSGEYIGIEEELIQRKIAKMEMIRSCGEKEYVEK